ncbi:MAG: tetratricopeptide repeat protein [Steroidobacteraceae bacterium]
MAISTTSARATDSGSRTVSRVVVPALKEAQAAMNSAHYPEALAKLHEAQTQADRTAFDEFEIDESLGFVHARMNDYRNAAFYMEAALRSGFMDPNVTVARIKMLAQLNYMAKNCGAAVEYGKQSLATNDNDEQIYTLVAQCLYKSRETAALLEFLEAHVVQREQQGHPADSAALNMLLLASTELDDKQRITKYLQRLSETEPRRYADKYAKWLKAQSSSSEEKSSSADEKTSAPPP